MTRRLVVLAAVLTVFAMPAFARRRALTFRGGPSCAEGTLVSGSYASLLAADGTHVYFVDEFGVVSRVPKTGGEVEALSDPLEWFPMSIAVDATHVYIGVLPFEALLTPMPGSILSVPKSGGVAGVLVSGVPTPSALATDDSHLYWAAFGTLDFMDGSLASDGRIERVTKDGAERTTLASDLSGSVGLVLDGNDVYFGETGTADDDPSVGLYRVAKSGGAVATIVNNAAVGPLSIDGNTLVFRGGTAAATGVFAVEKTGGAVRTLHESEELVGLHVADRRAYFLDEGESFGSDLLWVNIDTPGEPVTVRTEIDGDDFLLDGCAAIVNTTDGDLIRVAR